MTIKTNTRFVTITLRRWNAENGSYSPDFFADADTDFAASHPYDDPTCAYLAADDDLDDLIDWWQDTVADANAGNDTNVLAALSDEERERGDEYVLSVDDAN